jgi:hypothetical protein
MQIFINGIVSGAAIALLAVAFLAVYLPTRVFYISLAVGHIVAPQRVMKKLLIFNQLRVSCQIFARDGYCHALSSRAH